MEIDVAPGKREGLHARPIDEVVTEMQIRLRDMRAEPVTDLLQVPDNSGIVRHVKLPQHLAIEKLGERRFEAGRRGLRDRNNQAEPGRCSAQQREKRESIRRLLPR